MTKTELKKQLEKAKETISKQNLELAIYKKTEENQKIEKLIEEFKLIGFDCVYEITRLDNCELFTRKQETLTFTK
jgi:hypothetical protein